MESDNGRDSGIKKCEMTAGLGETAGDCVEINSQCLSLSIQTCLPRFCVEISDRLGFYYTERVEQNLGKLGI